MQNNLPRKVYDYADHWLINSQRWQAYCHRPRDIVISTSYKAGTTWMQTIVANLLFQDGQFPAPVAMMAPWLDCKLFPLEEIVAMLEAQAHRRFIKTHLPLDALPYLETARYIIVGRDGRDVFMSMWNHHTSYTDNVRGAAAEFSRTSGRDVAMDFDDIHAMWAEWIQRGWYGWESSGYPYWSHLRHMQSWWNYRNLENILFIHFTDLLADPEKQVRRVAAHLDIPIDENQLPGILDRIGFKRMKELFEIVIMPKARDIFRDGGQTFMNKGTNGRWREVLTVAELDQYKAAVERELTPDCARWLEQGRGAELFHSFQSLDMHRG